MLFRFQQPHDQQHPQRRIAAGLVAQVIIDEPTAPRSGTAVIS
jgi:hypothetical protein